MTDLLDLPRKLYTIAEYIALGETNTGYTELVDGRLLLTPTPGVDHAFATSELMSQLHDQVPPELAVVHAVDIDLELSAPDRPGNSRRPDVVVFRRDALKRDLLCAQDVLVAIEIATADSSRLDRRAKHLEYADAGIPNYWIVDITEPVSLVECHLAGDFGYQDRDAVTGEFTTDMPFPVVLRLDRLL
ncbi:Uma2 family endonuclease [Kutzneria sp. CA-103260]|uniref:Uma2 family endonuclease n=1 Tax=Kutzneria sp. CA-103260 TaxID=2802641 RepID=UPI001BA50C2C|nr:Uma2 family endonuclease [Kutzneria sp. CA-103260]QUQ70227.1 Putative restriction endonuclease [Kutzneria sp. CA-103260]